MPGVKLRLPILIVTAALAIAFAACGGESDSESKSTTTTEGIEAIEAEAQAATGIEPVGELKGKEPKLAAPPSAPPKKLVLRDLRKGSGATARSGDKVTIQFTSFDFKGKPFESSWDDFGKAFRFTLGTGKLSPGWEKGIPGMKVGGRREIVIPWDMVFPLGPAPNATPQDGLVYLVDLLAVG